MAGMNTNKERWTTLLGVRARVAIAAGKLGVFRVNVDEIKALGADLRELLLRVGRKVWLKAMCLHDLPRHCLKVDGRRLGNVRHVEKANMNLRV